MRDQPKSGRSTGGSCFSSLLPFSASTCPIAPLPRCPRGPAAPSGHLPSAPFPAPILADRPRRYLLSPMARHARPPRAVVIAGVIATTSPSFCPPDGAAGCGARRERVSTAPAQLLSTAQRGPPTAQHRDRRTGREDWGGGVSVGSACALVWCTLVYSGVLWTALPNRHGPAGHSGARQRRHTARNPSDCDSVGCCDSRLACFASSLPLLLYPSRQTPCSSSCLSGHTHRACSTTRCLVPRGGYLTD